MTKYVFFLVAGFCFILLGAVGTAQAQPYPDTTITVGGTDYIVSFHDGTWEDVNLTIDLTSAANSPWFGVGSGPSADFAVAVFGPLSGSYGSATIAGLTRYAFGYQINTTSDPDLVLHRGVQNTSASPASPTSIFASAAIDASTADGQNLIWVSASAVPVPEIDGPVLAKTTLILLAGYLWLRGRRRNLA